MSDPYYADATVRIFHGDCLDVLRELPDASVDAVVTDPPYGLEFMGKEWDSFKPKENQQWATTTGTTTPAGSAPTPTATGAADATHARDTTASSASNVAASGESTDPAKAASATIVEADGIGGFQDGNGGNAYSRSRIRTDTRRHGGDMVAANRGFQEWCQQWATECLRVLKPGGHMLAFGGTRTSHRLACAVEDAGFEIRDSIAWLYGSGFPKSLDVSKAIDRLNGKPLERMREFGAYVRASREAAGLTQTEVNRAMQMPQGCGWWEGKGLGAKWDLHLPGVETWQRLKVVISTLGDDWDWFIEWAEAEREKIGTRTTGIGTGRGAVAYIADSDNRDLTAPATDAARTWQGWGTALKPAHEPIVVARKPLAGTVAANVLAHGVGALNVDGCRVETTERLANHHGTNGAAGVTFGNRREYVPGSAGPENTHDKGRWPANTILDESQAAALDAQSGELTSGSSVKGTEPSVIGANGIYGHRDRVPFAAHTDTGGASRFFYTAKAASSERVKLDGTAHPTVKPLTLMRWLVRLVTPPGGTVLEPFAGSGTTVEACILEGFACIAIEREADYLPLIRQRIHRRRDPVEAVRGSGEDAGLFDLLGGEGA